MPPSADSPLAIACTLNAVDQPARMVQIAALGRDALLDVRRDGLRRELRFAATGDVQHRLEALVAAELQCCAFLGFELRRDSDEHIVLRVETTADGQAALDEFVAGFRRPAGDDGRC